MKSCLSAALFFCLFVGAKAQNKKILGVWWNDMRTSQIELFEMDGVVYGKIIWLKDDINSDGTAPRFDVLNPNEKLRKHRVLGMLILKELTWDASEKEWNGGEIYSPKHGKTFSCYAKLQHDGSLFLKGYVLGMPFLGASTTWTRP